MRKTLKARQSSTGVRRWQRLPLSIPVFIRGTDDKGNGFLEFATALDISAGGALVALRRYIEPGSSISLEIPCAAVPVRQAAPSIGQTLAAKLVRVSNAAQYHLLGLEFSKPIINARKTQRRKYSSAV